MIFEIGKLGNFLEFSESKIFGIIQTFGRMKWSFKILSRTPTSLYEFTDLNTGFFF